MKTKTDLKDRFAIIMAGETRESLTGGLVSDRFQP
jgi:hypothetical protein